MRWLANLIMSRRAERIFRSIRRHLPADGMIANIGSGNGHNAERIRTQTSLNVYEYDVADIHWTGPGPRLIEERILITEVRSPDLLPNSDPAWPESGVTPTCCTSLRPR